MLFADPNDPFTLSRFVRAQDRNYALAIKELHAGRKRSHWMWYVFPQFKGLGRSATSVRFAIRSMEEARAYLNDPLLGERLKTCAEVVLANNDQTVAEIFGFPDHMKFHSCMTLFAEASEAGSVFHKLLDKYYFGQGDPRTLDLLDANKE